MADLKKLFETLDLLSRDEAPVAEATDSDDFASAASEIDHELERSTRGDYKDTVDVEKDWEDDTSDFEQDLAAKFKDVGSEDEESEKFNLLFDIEDFQDRGLSASDKTFDVSRLRDLPLETLRNIHLQVVGDDTSANETDEVVQETEQLDEIAPLVALAGRLGAGMVAGKVVDKVADKFAPQESADTGFDFTEYKRLAGLDGSEEASVEAAPVSECDGKFAVVSLADNKPVALGDTFEELSSQQGSGTYVAFKDHDGVWWGVDASGETAEPLANQDIEEGVVGGVAGGGAGSLAGGLAGTAIGGPIGGLIGSGVGSVLGAAAGDAITGESVDPEQEVEDDEELEETTSAGGVAGAASPMGKPPVTEEDDEQDLVEELRKLAGF